MNNDTEPFLKIEKEEENGKVTKGRFIFSCVLAFFLLVAYCPFTVDAAKADKKAKPAKGDPLDQWAAKPNAVFDVDKMSDMSDYDPGTSVVPAGDTIKLAVVVSFSGPASIQGLWYYTLVQWVAHDSTSAAASGSTARKN
jgi:hypothetical protein